jgi:phosphoglycerate kinase
LFTQPERPLVVVLGSRETLDRIRNLYSLVLRADAVLVGGQMSKPFLAAIGHQPQSGETPEFLEECRHAYGVGNTIHHSIHLPSDLVWECNDGTTLTAGQHKVVNGSIGDIGPKTGIEYSDVLRGAGSILWVGSLGEVEDDRFIEGTLALGRALTGSPAKIVLGGDALSHILRRHGLVPESAEFVSATGSAVALLKDGDLPGLTVLRQASNATRTPVVIHADDGAGAPD